MDVGVVAHATGSAYVEFNHTKVSLSCHVMSWFWGAGGRNEGVVTSSRTWWLHEHHHRTYRCDNGLHFGCFALA